MNEVISRDVLDDIRKLDKRVVSNNPSGTGSTLISYISALRVKDDAKLFFTPHGNNTVLSYPHSKFVNQGDSVGDNIKDEFIVDKILEDDIFKVKNLNNFLPGNDLAIEITHSSTKQEIIYANHTYNKKQIEWFKEGSSLNLIANEKK